MKKVFSFILVTGVTVLGVSCQKDPVNVNPEDQQTPNLTTFTCAFPAMEDQNGTKVTLATDGATAWEAGVDQIVFQGCPKVSGTAIAPVTHTFTSSELANPEVALFSVDISGLSPDEGTNQQYNVAYPAAIWSSYSSSHMYGRSSFSNTNKMLMAGYVDGSSIVLKHMTAAITFKVAGSTGDYDSYTFEGNGDDAIVGYSKLLVEVNKPNVVSYRLKYLTDATYGTTGPLTKISGDLVSDGSTVNTVFLPVNAEKSGDTYNWTDDASGANAIYLPHGFTIKLLQGGVVKKYITAKAALKIEPGHMIDLGELPAGKLKDYVNPKRDNTIGVNVATAIDLSATATANCYIVDGSVPANAGASFKFKATKGKGGAVLSTIGGDDDKDVIVLWSTKNVATAPSANEIISDVDYDIQEGQDAYIVFKMPNPIVPGNAVIAAKDADGNILWSWHIWIPKDAISYSTYDGKSSKLMMSRNLGALVDTPADGSAVDVTSLGLHYQWGRKDPFVGAQSLGSTSFAGVSGTAKSNNEGKMSIEQTIANPTVFGNTSDTPRDWNSTPDNSLWGANGSTKTQYDPCPVGYRVPTRDLIQSFVNAVTTWTPDMTSFYVKADDITDYGFPITNYIYSKYGNLYGYSDGPECYIWTSYRSSDTDGTAYAIKIKNTGAVSLSSTGKASGGNVRCVAE